MGENKDRAAEDELWKLAFRRLVAWTMKTHRVSAADAEESVQEAARLFISGGGRADPKDPKALLAALGSQVNGVMVNRRRKKSSRAVELSKDGAPVDHSDSGDFERQLIDDDLVRVGISRVMERLDEDKIAEGVLMKMCEGIEEPAAQATALGCPVTEVYKARTRLKTHAEAVEKQLMEGS